MSEVRAEVIGRVADHLIEQPISHPLRVAVDGVTASGKTTFARELLAAIEQRGRPVIHVSMDGFHHRRAHRHRQGRDSAVGYYRDAYDFQSLIRLVLDPLGPDGDRRYQRAILDLKTDQPVHEPGTRAEPEAVLVVDGSFLQRDLAGRWDHVVYLDTAFGVARDRGAERDAELFGSVENALLALDNRYHAACRLYRAEVDPAGRADIVVDNDDLTRPVLQRIGRTAPNQPSPNQPSPNEKSPNEKSPNEPSPN